MIRRSYDVALAVVAVPTDPSSIEQGRRLAIIRGCYDGCHGKGVSGAVFTDDLWLGRQVAPELTQVFAGQTDAELERTIRHGVRPNGMSTWIMPSSMFHHLSDEDFGRIVAFIRSLPPGQGPATEVWIGPGWRLDLLRNRFLPMAEEIRRDAPWYSQSDRAGEHARGRYLALTVCSECHGMNLSGAADGTAPDLTIAAAYPEADFAHLMKTGVALGGRELGLMALVARERFSLLTQSEVGDLHRYLRARALARQTE